MLGSVFLNDTHFFISGRFNTMISLYCFDPSTYQISRTGYSLNASSIKIVYLAREPASGRFVALIAQGVILFFNPVNDSDPMSFNISGSQNLTL